MCNTYFVMNLLRRNVRKTSESKAEMIQCTEWSSTSVVISILQQTDGKSLCRDRKSGAVVVRKSVAKGRCILKHTLELLSSKDLFSIFFLSEIFMVESNWCSQNNVNFNSYKWSGNSFIEVYQFQIVQSKGNS